MKPTNLFHKMYSIILLILSLIISITLGSWNNVIPSQTNSVLRSISGFVAEWLQNN